MGFHGGVGDGGRAEICGRVPVTLHRSRCLERLEKPTEGKRHGVQIGAGVQV